MATLTMSFVSPGGVASRASRARVTPIAASAAARRPSLSMPMPSRAVMAAPKAAALSASSSSFRGLGVALPPRPARAARPARGQVKVQAQASAAICADLPEDEKKKFTFTRILVFLGILFGYSAYYLTRNSLTYASPVMVATPGLGIDITNVGQLTSIFPICYGFSKFVSGVVGAKFPPRTMLAGGLALTALVNIAFGSASSLTAFMLLWSLNGILQGFGGPACARILTVWFATKERGTYWGMWNVAHNLGGFAAPLIAGFAARSYGWRYGLWIPGAIGLAVAGLVSVLVKNSPEAAGYPPVELAQPESLDEGKEGEAPAPVEEMGVWENLAKNVLSRWEIWCMAFAYFCVYVLRQGVTSWSIFYLLKAKNVADVGQAAFRVSGLELGGLLGSLVAGKLSDSMISRDPKGGNVGKRVRVVMMYLVGVFASLAAFWAVPDVWWMQWLNVFVIGFCLYGPQMLIGLCGAELVGPSSVGASEGFLGWIAYLGAANAGIPLSIIVRDYGWNNYFVALFIACGVAMLLLAPMINLKSFVQRTEKKA
mmetsp:Transcript_12749/g.40299  ORF Transcript_12749/g.40299 Transcript_12749/m.40299 type:complete len:541 (-) Transcript_12749:11-1633(-)